MTVLEPRLTSLDERVLAAVPYVRGHRLEEIARTVHRSTGRGEWTGRGFLPSASQVAELRWVLRGLEHLGRVECRGGWWRRVS